MKSIVVIMAILLISLQYKLWFQTGGVTQAFAMQKQIQVATKENQALSDRNAAIVAEVKDLKHGSAAIAESARNNLSMIKPGETLYRVVS